MVRSRIFLISGALIILGIKYAALNLIFFSTPDLNSSIALTVICLGAAMLVFFCWILRLLKQIHKENKLQQEICRAQADYAKKMAALMQEERNDILNQISVVTAYLQVGQYEAAEGYLQFMAADQSDKYEHHSAFFPHDPWETVLERKQEQAEQKKIRFLAMVQAEPPADEHTKRLAARLMSNLVDAAFEAVVEKTEPRVWLRWYSVHGSAVLEVRHNNTDYSHCEFRSFKLPICRQIASEIGGKLTICKNDQDVTCRVEIQSKAIQSALAESAI